MSRSLQANRLGLTGSGPRSTCSAQPGNDTVISASLHLRELLQGPMRTARVLGGVSMRYVYLIVAGSVEEVVGVEGRDGIGLPISVGATSEMVDEILASTTPIPVGQGRLQIGSRRISVSRWRDDRLRLDLDSVDGAGMRMLLASRRAPVESVMVGDRVEAFSAAFGRSGSDGLERAAQRLIGLGNGSTPAGDDVIAGALVVLSALSMSPAQRLRCRQLRSAVTQGQTRTTPLSAALLRAAMEGYAVEPLRRFVGARDTAERSVALGDLLTVGHSSGYYLALGATLPLQSHVETMSGPQ